VTIVIEGSATGAGILGRVTAAETVRPATQEELPQAGERRVAGSALVTAASLVATMVLGGVLSLVIVLKFGKTAQTDGLFAAYSVYGVLALVAQSLRTTMVARLVEGRSLFAGIDRLLEAVAILFLLSGVPLVILGGPLADLLTGDSSGPAADTAQTALAILWLAGGAQLLAALSAAALGTRDEFSLAALAYVLGGLVAITGLFALEPAAGIDAVAIGVTAGSTLTAAILVGRLVSEGYRPRLRGMLAVRRALASIGAILGGAAGYMLFYLTLVVSVTFAARMAEGDVTLYSYAFFTAVMVMGATSGPAGVVMAAPLSKSWDGRPASLEPHLLAVFRTSLMLILPIIAVAALVGDKLVDLVLGSSLSGSDADSIVATFLGLSGMMVASVAMSVPLLAAFVARRYGAVSAIAAAGIGLQVLASAIAKTTDHLYALGIATSISTTVSLLLLLAVVYGREAGAAAGLLLAELFRVALAAALVFLPLGLAAVALGGSGWLVVAAALGLPGFVLVVRAALPEHWELAMRIVPRRPAPGTAGSPSTPTPGGRAPT
jgi:O-antigen/teichoic acid export membrane protein